MMAREKGEDSEFWAEIEQELRRVNARIEERARWLSTVEVQKRKLEVLALSDAITDVRKRRDAAIIREWEGRPLPVRKEQD